MHGRDRDDEPTGELYRRMPPRTSRPRDHFDPAYGTGHREDFDPTYESGYHSPGSAARLARGNGGRSGNRLLRLATRRVGNALLWFAMLVIAPLFVGILAGAVAEHIHL